MHVIFCTDFLSKRASKQIKWEKDKKNLRSPCYFVTSQNNMSIGTLFNIWDGKIKTFFISHFRYWNTRGLEKLLGKISTNRIYFWLWFFQDLMEPSFVVGSLFERRPRCQKQVRLKDPWRQWQVHGHNVSFSMHKTSQEEALILQCLTVLVNAVSSSGKGIFACKKDPCSGIFWQVLI